MAGIFYGEVRSHEETDRTWPEGGGGGGGERRVGCLRLHFKRFKKPVISRTFNLQR